jgi:hypothetical protein
MKQFQEDFFNKPKDVAVAEFKRRVDTFLGPNNVGTRHIEELHDLGYLPIRIKALPEGTLCPIRVPALTFIMQVGDILNRQGILFGLDIVYLMSMRMDRVISYDESFSLSIVTQVINDMFPQAVHVLEPHSHKVQDLVDEYWGDIATPMPDFEGYLRVYPDKGALQRYGGDPNSDVICSKVRDPKTGQLSGFKIENPEVIEKNVNLPFVVIDDLCDGGGTFKGIAQLLGFHYPDRERTIYVTHMVNPKGITTLSENYKEVYFTNSYKDWNKETLPDNVKVIEIV